MDNEKNDGVKDEKCKKNNQSLSKNGFEAKIIILHKNNFKYLFLIVYNGAY